MQTTTPTAEGVGTVYAYALTPRAFCLRSALPLISSEAPTAWLHVAYEGRWEGHPNGGFELDRECFEQIIRNFQAQANPIPLDFDHEFVFEDDPYAKGWVHDLEIRDDAEGRAHLYALAEFGQEAVARNKAGGLRYNSGVFEFGAVDRRTGDEIGCELTSVALTDRPFVDGQKPLVLSRRRAPSTGEAMKLDDIRALMAVPKERLMQLLEEAEGDELAMEAIEAAAHLAAAEQAKPDEPAPMADDEPEEAPAMDEPDEAPMADKPEDEKPMADEPDGDERPAGDYGEEDTAAVALQDGDAALAALAPLMERTGLDLPALAAAMQEKQDDIAQVLTGALEEPAAEAPLSDKDPGREQLQLSLRSAQLALGAVTTKCEALSARVEEYERKEAEAAVDVLIRSHGLLDTGRAGMVELYRKSPEQWAILTDNLKRVVPVGEHAAALTPPAEPKIEAAGEEEQKIEERVRKMHVLALKNGLCTETDVDNAVRKRLAAHRSTARAAGKEQ